MDFALTTAVQKLILPPTVDHRFVSLCRTSERQVAEKFVSNQWKVESNGAINFANDSDFEWQSFEFADLHGSWIRYGADLTFRGDGLEELIDPPWVFAYCIAGYSIGHKDNIEIKAGEAGAFRAAANGGLSLLNGFETLVLKVPARDLEDAQRALYGADANEHLVFKNKVDAGSIAASTLVRVITRLSEIPIYPQQFSHRLERSAKESALFELLLTWPLAISSGILQKTALPASTRLARDYIHAHLCELPTVSDVAASCRIGVRALDRGFKKHLGVSPLNYMLALRLQSVRDDLFACQNGNTIAEVATFWGFTNLGVFAARYQERFGELPSETLRQSRHSRKRLN